MQQQVLEIQTLKNTRHFPLGFSVNTYGLWGYVAYLRQDIMRRFGKPYHGYLLVAGRVEVVLAKLRAMQHGTLEQLPARYLGFIRLVEHAITHHQKIYM